MPFLLKARDPPIAEQLDFLGAIAHLYDVATQNRPPDYTKAFDPWMRRVLEFTKLPSPDDGASTDPSMPCHAKRRSVAQSG